MASIRVFDLFRKKALITRESARQLQSALRPLVTPGQRELILDFEGIDALTPSFVDEALTAIDEIYVPEPGQPFRVVFLRPPTRLSEKFAAIARAHEVAICEVPEGWSIQSPSEAPSELGTVT